MEYLKSGDGVSCKRASAPPTTRAVLAKGEKQHAKLQYLQYELARVAKPKKPTSAFCVLAS